MSTTYALLSLLQTVYDLQSLTVATKVLRLVLDHPSLVVVFYLVFEDLLITFPLVFRPSLESEFRTEIQDYQYMEIRSMN